MAQGHRCEWLGKRAAGRFVNSEKSFIAVINRLINIIHRASIHRLASLRCKMREGKILSGRAFREIGQGSK